MDYNRICFVIMPFGEKEVVDDKGNSRRVNFDAIYDKVFLPAIGKTNLPEGGNLEAHRTDRDFFSGDISQEMFNYLEYARIALTDISGLNPNVFYELGVRHRARGAGTVIFRQIDAKIPFDINQIKAFPYEYQPEEQALASQNLITRVLTESLQQIRLDSPAWKALIVQRKERSYIENDLRDAENAIRVGNRVGAIAAFRRALAADPGNNLLHLKLGLLWKEDGRWYEALEQFTKAVIAAPEYAEAYREKGIAENKIYHQAQSREGLCDGIEALTTAVRINPDDYDAHASLAGALKRANRLPEALAEYEQAVEVSHGHSYPLLNALKLKAQLSGKMKIDDKTQFQLKRAERSLRAQVASDPPYDPPWSFFDLAEIHLYSGDKAGFLSFAATGVENAAHKWQVNTFLKSLEALLHSGVNLPGLDEGINMLRARCTLLD